MPNTRKKIIKTVYKEEDDSNEETGDFSDSGSEAEISVHESSSDEENISSGEDFKEEPKKKAGPRTSNVRRKQFAKNFINKINKQGSNGSGEEVVDVAPALFSVKDLTDADKLLPSFLNLSESDSSDEDAPRVPVNKSSSFTMYSSGQHDSDNDNRAEYKDVFSNNLPDNSEEVARKTFMELQENKNKLEETKALIQNYISKQSNVSGESDIKDLLAIGEEKALLEETAAKKKLMKKKKKDSDSEVEDWEEVNDAKPIPQQGLQLIVDFPDAVHRKKKTVDVEMMMKRKINRVKKEYQVYMHKVHVLCWLGHGNYVSRVLNDQELMAAALKLVPSKECYPGERVDIKYVEQITTWFKDKFTLKQDKNEDKFRPKAPPLKDILQTQIKTRVVTTKKYLVFIFVSMLRAIGLQCRVMLNFVTLPIRPPSSELCSLSTKLKEEKKDNNKSSPVIKKEKCEKQGSKKSCKKQSKATIPQVDGVYDESTDEEFENIMQIDGNDDTLYVKTRSRRSTRITEEANREKEDRGNITEAQENNRRRRKAEDTKFLSRNSENDTEKEGSTPKKTRKSPSPTSLKSKSKVNKNSESDSSVVSQPPSKRKRGKELTKSENTLTKESSTEPPKLNRRNTRNKKETVNEKEINNMKNEEEKDNTSKIDKSQQKCIIDENTLKIPKVEVNGESLSTPKTKKRTTRKNFDVDEKELPKSATKSLNKKRVNTENDQKSISNEQITNPPKILINNEEQASISSSFFEDKKCNETKKFNLSRKRSTTANPSSTSKTKTSEEKPKVLSKSRTKSAPGNIIEDKSKYFQETSDKVSNNKSLTPRQRKVREAAEDKQRVSHRDLGKSKNKSLNNVSEDLVNIVKNRIKEAKVESKKGIIKGKTKKESDEDSDYLPEEPERRNSEHEDFKPSKISPKPSTSKKIDRRVLSSDTEEPLRNKTNVWCEIFVEELEQWVAVDIVKGQVHCTNEIYGRATHPVCYVVGWDNNNYLKDLTRRYVPHWNTVTRKQRAEPIWWEEAIKPWLGPKTAKDREEDTQLDRMQLEAPLPKSIAEYKNHPLYVLKRHLLKYEALYPADAGVLGFVRGEPVFARECVHVCRSRDTWLKEAKTVRPGELPYKIVKARPKWDRLSNKLITDKPLEIFGPWQVQDYEPPTAENGVVPRNAYGNVELFKACMLPKGTVHIRLEGLNKVAKKLNIDCAPAMTGFDYHGGFVHPVYDGFVVCQEFEEIITEAWVKDQEDQERKEREKIETRVYGNWKRLIKGLFIRERLKNKYGFQEPSTSDTKKPKGPRLVVKKK